MLRRNQPEPRHIRALAKRGFRTVVNLRGASGAGFYVLEREACERCGLAPEDFRTYSRMLPPRELLHGAKELFERIEYPAVMHCKSGADRAGFMAVLYQHLRLGIPMEEAVGQLSFRLGHIPAGKTGILDHFFRDYIRTNRERPIAFLDWADTVYDPDALKASFHAKWWGTLLSEWILDRE